MACYRPLEGHRGADGKLHFKAPAFTNDQSLTVPCGKCIGCRLDRSRDWAVRCSHEAQMEPVNAFLTLTYNDENYPDDGCVNVVEWQEFILALRRELGKKLRYLHCGEYGQKNWRAHYHAILFGYDFPDKKLYKVQNGNRLYKSELLTDVWGKGHCTIGSVTWQSSAYTARYIMSKINGEPAVEHYTRPNPVTGEIVQLKPEYNTMSRRPGLGATWFEKYWKDLYPKDRVTIRQKDRIKHYPIPRYYDKLMEKLDPDLLEDVKTKRIKEGLARNHDNTDERLAQKHFVKREQLKKLNRPLE